MKKRFLIPCLLFCLRMQAQETFPVNGVHNPNTTVYAFTHVTLYTDYQTRIDNATLLVKNGLVEKAGASVAVPKGAVVYDLRGKFIYPSFIESYSSYGMPEAKAPPARNPQLESNTKGAFNWNQAVKPEVDAAALFTGNAGTAEEMRKMGFGAALTFQRDGIVRGTSALVSLGDGKENNLLIADRVTANYSFDKGVSTQDYPSSQMGSIALLRQTYLDAKWYAADKAKREKNLSLEAFLEQQKLPQVFEVNDKFSALRADKTGDEFGVQYILKGTGDEYQRMEEIKSTRAVFLLPLNFPVAYDVSDPYDAMLVSLGEMKHWEMAPANPASFEKAKIPFALTGSDLKDKGDFRKNLLKAIEYGLSTREALKALTHTPALILGVANKLGALKEGMIANFIITSDTLFHEKNIIYQNWVQGIPYDIVSYDVVDIRGNYDLKAGDRNYKLKVGGEVNSYQATLLIDTVTIKVNAAVTANSISLFFDTRAGSVRLSGTLDTSAENGFKGRGQLENGQWVNWSAAYTGVFKKEEKKDSLQKTKAETGRLFFPNMAYGWTEAPKPENVLIRNATIWSNEAGGIFTGDVLVQNGKIITVGKVNVVPSGTGIIDASGKHLSSGIIDEHSHIAISNGVNEGAQASSAEVRIGDVVNSDDINIYRQLSGGVTASQLLHGSANPIGGQSAIIKLRWGMAPDRMQIEGADGFIKFALGENVKQSNWGDRQVIRFPQTRMGVEQVYYDAFQRAKEYEARWKKFNGLQKEKSGTAVPRRDLELEALVEILHKKRFITCHSYVQSEINMLMHVGDSMGFTVNTFTHILEGYKVADKMKAHGAGASTFSDWWAYKFEVKDAIPYNSALLTRAGLVTAVNSDDAEMARRLNQEAAKAVKYGGLSQEEAWKLVTLNPAKLLHLDKRLGSIKEGKDADLVIWSDNPLSIYAKVEKTFVDGIVYYDAEKDRQLRAEIADERNRLIQKMLTVKKEGGATQKPSLKKPKLYHCDDLETGTHEN